MSSPNDLVRGFLASAHATFRDNVRTLTLDEALFSAGGYRSILGVIKHAAMWAHVYRSYAFDPGPKHLNGIDWPRGLRWTVDTSKGYVDEVVAWLDEAMRAWDEHLAATPDEWLDHERLLHWGATAPLATIAGMVANHTTYHAGELNMLLSIARGEAWEYTEEVEENHISTLGHGVRGEWMTDEKAHEHQEHLRALLAKADGT